MTYGGLNKQMDAAAELRKNPISKHQPIRFSPSVKMSRLARDGTAEPVSRDQILRRERGQGNIHFPVQLTTSRIGNLTRLIHTLARCDDVMCNFINTHTHTRGRGRERRRERGRER